MAFDNIETLVPFSFVWYVCVAARHKMNVWQGSCKVKCVWRKSPSATMEGCVAVQISMCGFWLSISGRLLEIGF